jgi:hypothetical protein
MEGLAAKDMVKSISVNYERTPRYFALPIDLTPNEETTTSYIVERFTIFLQPCSSLSFIPSESTRKLNLPLSEAGKLASEIGAAGRSLRVRESTRPDLEAPGQKSFRP